MSDVQTRYSLVLEIVRKREGANLVLADLLEEEGEIDLAQWARGLRLTVLKRIEFALQCLPTEIGLRLACVFLEHALDDCRNAASKFYPGNVRERRLAERNAKVVGDLLDSVSDLRHAIELGELNKVELARYKHVASSWANEFFDQALARIPHDLFRAGMSWIAAAKHGQANDRMNSNVHAANCRDSVRRVARGSRLIVDQQSYSSLIITPVRYEHERLLTREYDVMRKIKELEWQLAQVETTLEEMISDSA